MRLSGPLPEAWRALPCYAVGEATAKAAAERGFTRIIVGDGDASALAAQMAADGVGVALHLAGREHRAVAGGALRIVTRTRSEEHTSELQSLMRISYAGFCLKKKKTQ